MLKIYLILTLYLSHASFNSPQPMRFDTTLPVIVIVLVTSSTGRCQDTADNQSELGRAIASDQAKRAAGEEPEKTVLDDYVEEYVGPDDRARVAYLAPANAKRLTKKSSVWVDVRKKRVYLDGYVAMRDGALEMFACPVGTKEHESIVAVLAKSREVHAGLLAIGAKPGSPVQFRPEFVPAKGAAIRVWVCWRDEKNKFHVVDARKWVQRNGTQDQEMTSDWVFGGSGFWKDPEDGREYYRADGGDMICVSNFSTAMLDVNVNSSADAGHLLYIPFVERIPDRYTPVRLVLTPIVDGKADKPNEIILARNKEASSMKPGKDSPSN